MVAGKFSGPVNGFYLEDGAGNLQIGLKQAIGKAARSSTNTLWIRYGYET